MKSVDIPLEDFEKYFTWNRDRYTRNSLVKTDDFELLLVCWEKGQGSVVHDYDSHMAWVRTIHGELKEERFMMFDGKLERVSSVHLGKEDFSYLAEPIAIHRYSNKADERTVSLHLYVGPIEEWTEYDLETGEKTHKKVSHDSVYRFTDSGAVRVS
jgi:cysteine dioxygenase